MKHKNTNIRFSVIADSKGHIEMLIDFLLSTGANFVSYYAIDLQLKTLINNKYPSVRKVDSIQDILLDRETCMVVGACNPNSQFELGIQVMRHGKDYFCDKPGYINLDQFNLAKRIQSETQRLYLVFYCEVALNRATQLAKTLITEGEIGSIVQIMNLGPHLLGNSLREKWFWDKDESGGILTFIGCHQFEQLLYLIDYQEVEIEYSRVMNRGHKQYKNFQDFGEVIVKGKDLTGYIRVDWLSPVGLRTFGDGRIIILGTDGYIEVRKFVDLNGRIGGEHLFIVNQKETRYIDCNSEVISYGDDFIENIQCYEGRERLSYQNCRVAELFLLAQKVAENNNFDE